MNKLNETVIVTFGATSAIAQSVLRLWAERGAQLALVGRDKAKLETVAGDLKVRGASRVEVFEADLADTALHSGLIGKIQVQFGKLDMALIAHGTLPDQKAAEQDFRVAAEAIHINFVSPASLCSELANTFERQGHGTLGVLASPAGERGRQSNYVYGSAKGGLAVFLQGLRNRLASKNVQVVTLIPGMVDTPMTDGMKKGPLFTKPEKIAPRIVSSMERGRNRAYLPSFWFVIMTIIRSIPEPVFKRLKL